MDFDKLTQKKKLLEKHKPLPEPLVHNLDNWFRVELTYNSNAIEGNTLTRQETAMVVEKGITVGGKTLNEHLEATNHVQALEWVKQKTGHSPKYITEKDILTIHEYILRGINSLNAGRYRNIAVRIAGSMVIMPNPVKVPELMKSFSTWLKQSHSTLHPVELAAEAHYKLVTIHPFIDGNGRTARLLMNMILLMHGYPMAIIRKRDRLAYINSLEKAQLGGSLDDYFKLIINAVDRSLNVYIKAVSGKMEKLQDTANLLKIGELAEKVGVSNATIRYWTKEGLLEVAEITPSGYQLYSKDMIEQVKKIHVLKEKRYTLQEIKNQLNR
jgi:Fic family protein